jgi:plastocyanin domain-containing protein
MKNSPRRNEMKKLLVVFSVIFFCIMYFSIAQAQKKLFTATVDTDGIQRVQMAGGEYFFDPDHIVVRINIPVEIKIRKTPGIVPHNIMMNTPEAGMVFSESFGTEPKVIRFTPKKTGKYPFSCDKKIPFFKSHKDKGMEGIIEVIE